MIAISYFFLGENANKHSSELQHPINSVVVIVVVVVVFDQLMT